MGWPTFYLKGEGIYDEMITSSFCLNGKGGGDGMATSPCSLLLKGKGDGMATSTFYVNEHVGFPVVL